MRACSACAGDYEDPERGFVGGERGEAGGWEDAGEDGEREGTREGGIPAAKESGREVRPERRSE
jgi:hypothetical protein